MVNGYWLMVIVLSDIENRDFVLVMANLMATGTESNKIIIAVFPRFVVSVCAFYDMVLAVMNFKAIS